jgi:hypothetical protein
MKSVFLFLMFLLSFSSCKKSDESAVNQKIMTVKLPSKEDATLSSSYDKKSDALQNKVNIEQKIVKEGNIKFETNDLEATYSRIQKNIIENGATIQNDTEGKDSESVFRKLIVRVPSQNFDVFIKSISKGVAYFDNKEISSQDVTEEYIDIDARLKAKKVLESRYLELLKKANKVTEMLEIEKQLSAIREEIEAKEGQLRYMQSRVSMSTITIEFYKTVANESGVMVSFGTKIWNAIKSGFNGFSSFFIGLLSIWPFLIIFATAAYYIRKRFKKKTIQS